MELTEFLVARLAEDEQVAHAAGGQPWSHDGRSGHHDPNPAGAYCTVTGPLSPFSHDQHNHVCGSALIPDATHIARHDPARVLADVARNRRIVELHSPKDPPGHHLCPVCVSWGIWRAQEPGEPLPLDDYPCATLRLLALPYASHEAYREEWAP